MIKLATEYLRLVGFGRYGCKKYGAQKDEPVWWNKFENASNWYNFKGPSYHSIKIATGIIEAILCYYNVNIESLTPVDNELSEVAGPSHSKKSRKGNPTRNKK